jgi:thiosulfate dehydrogenase (quinone) large subunit
MPKKKNNVNAVRLAYTLALARISLGFIFLWAFLDKLIGLGFATCRDAAEGTVNVMCDAAWLSGGSPTYGFLTFGTAGPFQEVFSGMAGNVYSPTGYSCSDCCLSVAALNPSVSA